MTTPRELITGALRLINVVQANESPTADDMDISFEALNAMLDSWSTEKLSIYSMNPYEFQLTAGQKEYALGPTGDWVIDRPMELMMMYVMYLDGGGECPIPTPTPPAVTYNYYGYFVVRNGYDGDVGIAGYITESNPFYSPFSLGPGVPQTYPTPAESKVYLTTGSNLPSSNLNMGGGDLAGTEGEVGPIAIAGNRQYTTDWNTNFQRYFYVPMRETDEIWVVDTYFAGYGDVFSVDVVVGPSPTEGEWYNCYGNSVYDYEGTIIIERLAWAGDR